MVPVPGRWSRHLFLLTYIKNIAEKRDLQDRGIPRVSSTELSSSKPFQIININKHLRNVKKMNGPDVSALIATLCSRRLAVTLTL